MLAAIWYNSNNRLNHILDVERWLIIRQIIAMIVLRLFLQVS